jgi:hypothetical protein
MFSMIYTASRIRFHSVSFQKLWPVETRLSRETGLWVLTASFSIPLFPITRGVSQDQKRGMVGLEGRFQNLCLESN